MLGPRSRSYKNDWSADGYMSRKTINDVVVEFDKLKAAGTLVCNPADLYSERHFAKVYMGFKGQFTRPGYPTSTKIVASYQTSTWRPTVSDWSADKQNSSLRAWKDAIVHEFLDEHEKSVVMTELSARMTEGIASLLVSFAERDQTKNMLLKALNYLRRPLQDVLKIGKRMTTTQRVDKVNEWWLEGRYGWRPFIHDVIGVVDAQKASVTDRRTVKTTRPSAKSSVPSATVTTYGWNGLLSTVTRDISFVGHYSFGQTADFRAGVIANFRKFGLYDLVGAGWDLVPYSFVVDWFINIGEVARAMQAYALLDERIGWIKYNGSLRSNLMHSIVIPGPIPYGSGTVQIIDSYGVGPHPHFMETSWNRDVWTDFMPTVGLRNELDWLKVVDSAALLRNLWTKVRGR